jgi:phage FluMu protein Com
LTSLVAGGKLHPQAEHFFSREVTMAPPPSTSLPRGVRWQEMRCVRCARLLQRIEEEALRPGRRLEIKCTHCKLINYKVGEELQPLAS